MAAISVNYKTNLELTRLTYAQLCDQQLPIRSARLCNSSNYTDRYKGYPVECELKEDFKDFLRPLNKDVQDAFFPVDSSPVLYNEMSVQIAFRDNVLIPIKQCFGKKFDVSPSISLEGNGTPDFSLLHLSDEKPFVLIEVKQWSAFNKKSRTDLANRQEGSDALMNCVELPSCPIDAEKREDESDGQFHWRLGMRQLKYYLHHMKITEAYGILTSYCHSFFVILRRSENASSMVVSPVVRFCEAHPLKKMAEFINKAYESERHVIPDLPIQISPVKTRQGSEYGKQEGNSKKRGINEEKKDAEIKKKKKNDDKSKQCGYLYTVTELIGEGRHGSVFRIVDDENRPFLAKCIRDKCSEDIMSEFENEKRIYHKLEKLQGDVLPRYFFNGLMDGWRDTIILEQLPAVPISIAHHLSEKEKMAIADCLKKIHEQGILHGDIRSQNILINRSKNLCHIIDFGMSREGSSEELKEEMDKLKDLLNNF